MNELIKTTCPYCGVGCGIEASVDRENRIVQIQGDREHPANYGRLCSKGSALGETLELGGRLLQPKVFGQDSDWNQALDLVAQNFQDTIAKFGPESVAFYGSGQLLTEDYYVANKLMKGFIGSANIDTNSRLCMSSTVSGHKRAFGSDTVPGCYEDFDHAELIVLIGSNAAWCHPVLFQRLRSAKTANSDLKIVVIDPRKTNSCEIADLHLPLTPGSDAWLLNGLLHYLQQQGHIDTTYIAEATEGFSEALKAAEVSSSDINSVAERCGVQVDDVDQFYRWFAAHSKVISLFSQGVNQSSSGTDKVNALINCHLATGRIGKPGMGPFSLTGQPNAMGGREVGGLANQLAAHMDFAKPADIDRIARFWNSNTIAQKPGYSAGELFEAIYDGKIKAIWIMGTNPVVSLPNADKVKQALQRCEFVVVSDCCAKTDTTALAHVLLPAQGWSEKDGTVTNSERRISRQRSLLAPAGNAQPDWWIIAQVAKRMGFSEAFNFNHPVDIFREHATLSGYENNAAYGLRDFDISGLAEISEQEYQTLQPMQWPINNQYPLGRNRLFDDRKFFTESGKAQFIAITPKAPINSPDQNHPMILNTGRIRDQWHTMTRTALAPKLNQHKPEAFVEVHPSDSTKYGLPPNGLAMLESYWGSMLARIQITNNQQPGSVFVPMHWTEQWTNHGRMGALVNPVFDPISKQPESKHTPVSIKAYQAAWYGFIISRQEVAVQNLRYWCKSKGAHYFRYELADDVVPDDWRKWVRTCLVHSDPLDSHWQEYHDSGVGHYRAAQIIENRLESIVFIAPSHHALPERGWLVSLFDKIELTHAERTALLTGQPPIGIPSVGTIICACFNVGEITLQTAIKEQKLLTVQEVGKHLRAGTNCGSCVPEIKAIISAATT